MSILQSIVFSLLVASIYSLFCNTPQRAGWISFETFSGMDHIANVFEAINPSLISRNQTQIVNSISYNFFNFTIAAWYNDAKQEQSYISQSVAKVVLGRITISFNFSYYIEPTKRGTASGMVTANAVQFRKQIYLNGGSLAWDLQSVDQIAVTSNITLERIIPSLSDEDRTVLENILNLRTDNKSTLISQALKELNDKFKNNLTDYLQKENIVVESNEEYKYQNITVTYTSNVKEQKLTNVGFKGLKFTCFFELQNYTKQCIDMPTDYIPEYGGLQELIAFPWLEANLLYLAKNGFFTTTLSNNWQTEVFQFYMGDVANVIPEARKLNPSTPVTAQCQWRSDQQNDTFVDYFTNDKIYVHAPIKCILSTTNSTIQTISLGLALTLQLRLTKNYISVVISSSQAISIDFQSAGSYIVTGKDNAKQIVNSIAGKLTGRTTFGNKFSTTERKAPSLRVTRNKYFVMFDSSET